MSPENLPPPPQNHSTPPKTTSPKPPPPQEPPQKCPRCDSPNTKFCYYNNYSLTQPRHFCKTCRRYWTKGGALRSVPIGGGCRKPARSSRLKPHPKPGFLLPAPNPGLVFPLGGLHPATAGVFTQFVTGCSTPTPTPAGGGAYLGLDLTSPNYNDNQIIMSSMNDQGEMHWKVQAQRLGLLYDQDNNINININNNKKGDLFSNLEVINDDLHGGGGGGVNWGDLLHGLQ